MIMYDSDRVADIRRRLEAATTGPHLVVTSTDDQPKPYNPALLFYLECSADRQVSVCTVRDHPEPSPAEPAQVDANAAFFAVAWDDVSFLLYYVERLGYWQDYYRERTEKLQRLLDISMENTKAMQDAYDLFLHTGHIVWPAAAGQSRPHPTPPDNYAPPGPSWAD